MLTAVIRFTTECPEKVAGELMQAEYSGAANKT
jgi:hypothetical protein